jgi:hypothetical protein
MKKILALCIAAGISGNCLAATGWTGPTTILELETHSDGTEIRLDGYNNACTSVVESGVQKTWTKVGSSQGNKEQLMSVILMAFAAGKNINVYCSDPNDWAEISNIKVVP